jgi:arylsulfatase A-like enzyme
LQVDWLPTFLSLVGAKPAHKIDGVSQWEALTVPGTPPARSSFIYNIDPVANLSAIRIGAFDTNLQAFGFVKKSISR